MPMNQQEGHVLARLAPSLDRIMGAETSLIVAECTEGV